MIFATKSHAAHFKVWHFCLSTLFVDEERKHKSLALEHFSLVVAFLTGRSLFTLGCKMQMQNFTW